MNEVSSKNEVLTPGCSFDSGVRLLMSSKPKVTSCESYIDKNGLEVIHIHEHVHHWYDLVSRNVSKRRKKFSVRLKKDPVVHADVTEEFAESVGFSSDHVVESSPEISLGSAEAIEFVKELAAAAESRLRS